MPLVICTSTGAAIMPSVAWSFLPFCCFRNGFSKGERRLTKKRTLGLGYVETKDVGHHLDLCFCSGDVLSRSFVAPWSFEQIHRFSL